MLDVHAPEHKIGGVRDFAVHLLTITAGLLIAIALESAVEALHHRHQRIEAEGTIREELQDNRAKLLKMQGETTDEIKNLNKALVFLEDLRSGKKDDPRDIKLGFNVEPLQDAGWRTAMATGAVSYIDPKLVQKFATAYHEQENYEAAVTQALLNYEVLDTYIETGQDPRDMGAKDIDTAISDLRRSLADLHSMFDWGRGGLKIYEEVLH